MRKKGKNDIEKIYAKFGLTMLSEFTGVDNKVECIDVDGYKYSITPYNLSKRTNPNIKSGRFNDKNLFKEYNIYHFFELNVPNKTEILCIPDKLDGEEAVFKCGECGKEFKQLWRVFMNNNPNKCCQNCSFKLKKSKKKSIEYIKDIFNKAEFKIKDKKQSFGMHYAYYIMDEDGYRGRMLPYTAMKKNAKIERFHCRNKYSIENINLYCKLNDMNVECLSSVFGTYTPLEFVCSCGEHFFALWDNVLKGKHRCNKCSNVISNNERLVADLLKHYKVKYISQYSINNCGKFKRLYFDFYIPKHNIFIEVDGEQHFRPVKFGGVSLEQAKINFELQKERDVTKERFCKENNYTLIHITYKQIKDKSYKEIIHSIFGDME